MTTAAKPGRPAKGSTAMTGAQRAAAFRRNRRDQATMVTDNLNSATTAVLLAGLGRQIKHIQTDADYAPTGRDVAARIIRELCSRNEITLS